MGLIALNPETGKILTISNKIYTSSCYIPEYASCDVCCFLNPSPQSWEQTTIYSVNDCVTYNSQLWYSKINSNLNKIPSSGAFWGSYTACGNEDWDKYPKFGGIGRTPKRYLLVRKYRGHTWWKPGVNCSCVRLYREIDDTAILTINCSSKNWSYQSGKRRDRQLMISADPIPCGSTYDEVRYYDSTPFYNLGMNSDITKVWVSNTYNISTTGCMIEGTMSKGTSYPSISCPGTDDTTDTVYIRPLDCNYEMWSSTKTYSMNDCVTWLGGLFKSCINLNLNNEPQLNSPPECLGGYYWKKE